MIKDLLAYILVVAVKFLSSLTAKNKELKHQNLNFSHESEGGRKPDLRFTVGSGWDNFGK